MVDGVIRGRDGEKTVEKEGRELVGHGSLVG